MEIKTFEKTGKGFYLYLIIGGLMFALSPIKWYYSLAFFIGLLLFGKLTTLQLIANNEMILFRYPYNFFISDWKLYWKNVREIEYVQKDKFIEGRNVTDYILIKYINDQIGKERLKRFTITLLNDDLEKFRQLCGEMQVSLKVKETYFKRE